jgi:effector-binding domain-containing protein
MLQTFSMKKFFRFIGILLLLIIGVFLILCLSAPKEVNMTKSVSIKAPKQLVWEQMLYFKNWDSWSPWVEKDPTTKVTLSGNDGTVGSGYSWVAEKMGQGTVTNSYTSGDSMHFNMQFIKPFEATPDGFVKVEDEGNGMTKASWNYHGENNFIGGGFMKLMELFGHGLDKDYERGLQRIKEKCEKMASETPAAAVMPEMKVMEMQFPGHTYAGVRKLIGWNEMDKFFMDTYPALKSKLGDSKQDPASALYYTWDTAKHQTDVAAVFPVSDAKAAKGATVFTIPASKSYMIAYQGPYSNMKAAHNALGKHLADKNEKMNLVIEEYVKNDNNEKDSTKWVTNIYYLVK